MSPEERDAAGRVLAAARAMSAKGLSPGRSGNVSERVARGFVVTPSGLAYDAIGPDDLVVLSLEGAVLDGARKPSSEAPFHAAIYRARPEIQAIVHTHSPQATALSCARRPIPAFHYMVAMAGGHAIPCADYATFGTDALAESAVRALDGVRATLLANHGVIALGRTPDAALALAEEVENLARQYLALLASGLTPVVLDEAEMGRVVERFRHYGQR
ncbi:MAG TPA: class II aldolase/adducin family protein [Beijerinckiaceae bacterium]